MYYYFIFLFMYAQIIGILRYANLEAELTLSSPLHYTFLIAFYLVLNRLPVTLQQYFSPFLKKLLKSRLLSHLN
jgi:hypothetical protein